MLHGFLNFNFFPILVQQCPRLVSAEGKCELVHEWGKEKFVGCFQFPHFLEGDEGFAPNFCSRSDHPRGHQVRWYCQVRIPSTQVPRIARFLTSQQQIIAITYSD